MKTLLKVIFMSYGKRAARNELPQGGRKSQEPGTKNHDFPQGGEEGGIEEGARNKDFHKRTIRSAYPTSLTTNN
jgi:hypothetical protein